MHKNQLLDVTGVRPGGAETPGAPSAVCLPLFLYILLINPIFLFNPNLNPEPFITIWGLVRDGYSS